MWWYEKNNQPLGPIDAAGLKKLLDAGTIKLETRVWRGGMQEWVAVGSIRELAAALAIPPPLSQGVVPAESGRIVEASAQQRVVARLADMLVHSALAFVFLGFAFKSETVAALERYQAGGLNVGSSIAWLAMALLLEALLAAIFGNSIGKALVGIQLRRLDGTTLSLWDRVIRGMGLFSHGFGIGIPLVNLACAVWQVNRFQKGQPATYDTDIFFVEQRQTAAWRTFLVFLAFTVVAGLASVVWRDLLTIR